MKTYGLFLALMAIGVTSFAGICIAQHREEREQNQKWTYVLVVVKDQPAGKVTETVTFESLEDLRHYVANSAKSAPGCACGEDCTCVDCTCEQRKTAKQPSKEVLGKAKKAKQEKPKLSAVELYLKHQNEIGGATEYGERSNSGGLVGGIKCEKE